MTKEELIDLIHVHSGIAKEKIEGKTTMADLNYDSLDRLEVVMRVEEDLRIMIDDDAAEKHFGRESTIDSMVAYLQKRMS